MGFEYIAVLVMFLVAVALAGVFLAFSICVGRIKTPQPEKKFTTYECGKDTIGTAWRPINVSYFVVALVFILFDIEAIFLYPWAVVFKQAGWWGFCEGIIFLAVLLAGFIYIIRKGAIEWATKTGR